MKTTKTHNYECCMCGDHGLSYELFRCKVCRFRSQHRYCSNLYPKAESYRVCNWCLIQKDSDQQDILTPTTPSSNNSNSPSSQENHPTTKTTTIKKFIINNNHAIGPKTGISPKSLQPISPIKKPAKSPEIRSPSGRKRIINNGPAPDEEELRRTKTEGISNNNNNFSTSSSRSRGGGGGGGGPAVIKHVFRNKVRRYKLLDEVSS